LTQSKQQKKIAQLRRCNCIRMRSPEDLKQR